MSKLSLLFSYFLMLANGQEIEVDTEEFPGHEKMTFTPPQLSEEDQHGIHMPDYLKCDGCMAVSFTLHKAFESKHSHVRDQEWKLNDGDVIDLIGNSNVST